MAKQLFFELDFTTTHTPTESTRIARKRRGLQRVVLRWLEGQSNPPTGACPNVVTRVSRLRADIAAFWSVPRKNSHSEGPSQILVPSRTMIVQCYIEREDCWPDCIKSQAILPQLKDLKKKRDHQEQQIDICKQMACRAILLDWKGLLHF